MRSGVRSRQLLVVLVLLAFLLLAPWSPLVERKPLEQKTEADVQFVRPVDNGSAALWPYTSRTNEFEQATLPINVLVHADATTVNRLLVTGADRRSNLYWNRTAGAWSMGETDRGNVTINGTGIHWGESQGSARYTFVVTEEGGQWMDSTDQLHDGSYFGSRYHLRLYEDESADRTWTAIQAHHEYWDWFRLRHDVDSLSRAQHYVERDFLGTGLLASIERERWGNGGAIDADGWVTVIDLKPRVTRGPRYEHGPPGPAPILFTLSLGWLAIGARVGGLREAARAQLDRLRESRIDRHYVGLFASTALLPLVVRIGAITVERAFPSASAVAVGGPFYLLLVLGLPACALLFGRGVAAEDGFVAAVLGMGTGIMADYAYLGLGAIPYGALVQRIVLLVALGLIAAGGTRWSTDPVPRHRFHSIGLAVWIGALLWPLV